MVIHFELAIFGNALHAVIFTVLLLRLCLRRRSLLLVMHNAAVKLGVIGDQIGHPWWSPLSLTYFLAVRTWYHLLDLLPLRVAVLEPAVARMLAIGGYARPIAVIPHGVSTRPPVTAALATRTGDPRPTRLLVFGFPAWYKGTDLVPRWARDGALSHRYHVTVAGSPNPLHVGKARYMRYLASLARDCEDGGVEYISDVQLSNVQGLFADADVVVLPYRVLVGASGVLAQALEYRKPFALSEAVLPWLDSPHFKDALRDHGLEAGELAFRGPSQLLALLDRYGGDTRFRHRVLDVIDCVAAARSWEETARRYWSLLLREQHP